MEHSIGITAKRTGLTPHTIRNWEARYNAVQPKRTSAGMRSYSDADIEKLTLLRLATDEGFEINNIAKFSVKQLRELFPTMAQSNSAQLIDDALVSILKLDSSGLFQTLDRALMILDQPALVEAVIIPLIQKINDEWRDGRLRMVHEQLATTTVRTFVANLNSKTYLTPTAPEIIVTTLAGQHHALGALLAALTASSEGWKATFLGPNLPADEIAIAVNRTGVRTLALSIVHSLNDAQIKSELKLISELVDVPILIGGLAAPTYQECIQSIGARLIPDYSSFRTELRLLQSNNRTTF